VYDVSWRVRLWPTSERLAAMQNPVVEAVLITGILTAALGAWLAHFAQVAQRRASEAEAVNRELAYEIAERQRAEGALGEA
jgi:uncharacterized membrane protein